MTRNSIKDDELEKVNGGTQSQTNELRSVFQIGEKYVIKYILFEHGIDANLYDDANKNSYVIRETGEKLRHHELMDLIRENHWNE